MGLKVRGIFLDISKVFDKVWHDQLIFKLRQDGVCGKMINILEDFLIDRKQKVEKSKSKMFSVRLGLIFTPVYHKDPF